MTKKLTREEQDLIGSALQYVYREDFLGGSREHRLECLSYDRKFQRLYAELLNAEYNFRNSKEARDLMRAAIEYSKFVNVKGYCKNSDCKQLINKTNIMIEKRKKKT